MASKSYGGAVTDRIVRYALGALIGFLFALLLFSLGALSINAEISAGNVLQACATVITGFLIAFVVQRTLQNTAREKDFLIRQLDVLASYVAELAASDDGRQLTQVTSTLKKMRTLSTAIHEIASSLNRRGLAADTFDFGSDIKELRRLATETPVRDIKAHAAKSRVKSEVKDGIIKLAEDREAELDVQLQQLSSRILMAQVSVIKS